MTDIVAQLDPRFQRVSTQQQGATEIQRPKRVARQYQNHPPATALGYYYQGSLSGVWWLAISDYFLNEDNFGKVHAEGDHRIHVARVTEDNLILDPRFQLDFNAGALSTGPARPHGVVIK